MAPKIDFTKPLAAPLTGPTGGSSQGATSSTMTPGERQRRWNANNLDVNGGLRNPANSLDNTSGVVEDDVSGVNDKGSRNNPPPPPRAPSEEQRYNSATRAFNTTVAMNNPRGLGNQSKYRQSQGNVVAGSLQAKIEADKARGKTDPWTGWGTYHSRETRPVLHSIKGADGTTYYQQVDGKAGTARYWSVDSSGNRTEYTGDDKVSARDQINAARKNADLEAKKNYWRSRGVQFGETDEKGNFTGKFEKLTAEGARAEYNRKFGKAEREIQDLRNAAASDEWHEIAEGRRDENTGQKYEDRLAAIDKKEAALDQQRLNWSRSGEGRESYNWTDKTNQSPASIVGPSATQVDWNAAGDQLVAEAREREGLVRGRVGVASHAGAEAVNEERERREKVRKDEEDRIVRGYVAENMDTDPDMIAYRPALGRGRRYSVGI